MKVGIVSVMVNDQEKAHRFYTEMLGFATKLDNPAGDFRFLTVTAPDAQDGVQLLLEPIAFAPAQAYQAALYAAGMPVMILNVADVQATYSRLLARGAQFRSAPEQTPWGVQVILDDTVGNWLLLAQA